MDVVHTLEEEDKTNRELLFAQSFPRLQQEVIPLRASLHRQESLIGALGSEISSLDFKILSLKGQVTSLEAHVEELGRRRRAVVESSALKKALLAPVRRLAPEILGEIFTLCIDESLNISVKSAPLLLLLVCSQWRRVATSTSKLWTRLVMRWPNEVNVNLHAVVPMWLINSRSLPIHIYLNESGWRHPEGHNFNANNATARIQLLDFILGCISPHLERIETFHYSGLKMKQVVDRILDAPDGCINMPLLRNFELAYVYSRTDALLHHSNRKRTIMAPGLRVLDVPHRFLAEIHQVHLLNLKSLSIRWESRDSRKITKFLTILPNSSLEVFALIRFSSLCMLRCPALAWYLERFIFTSALKRLTLIGTTLSYEDTEKILVALPTLESLAISDDQVDPKLLCMDPGDPKTWILPRLSSILIEPSRTQAAADIIESRAVHYHWALDKVEGFRRLTHIDLRYCEWDESEFSELRNLTHDLEGFLFEPEVESNHV